MSVIVCEYSQTHMTFLDGDELKKSVNSFYVCFDIRVAFECLDYMTVLSLSGSI